MTQFLECIRYFEKVLSEHGDSYSITFTFENTWFIQKNGKIVERGNGVESLMDKFFELYAHIQWLASAAGDE